MHPHLCSKGQLLTLDPLKVQLRLEVMSGHPQRLCVRHAGGGADLGIMATGSVQGVKPLTRLLSCCLFAFLLPADERGCLLEPKHKYQSHTNSFSPAYFLLLKSFALPMYK